MTRPRPRDLLDRISRLLTIVGAALPGGVLLIGLFPTATIAQGPEPPPEHHALLDTGHVPETYAGILLPGRTALMKSKHSDQVIEVTARVGAAVKKDQLLLRLTDREESVARDRAEALLTKAKADYGRVKKLHQEGGTSDDGLETAETNLRLAQADFDLAAIRLADRSIRSPFDGILAERYVDPGTSVEEGDPLLRVSSVSPLRMEAILPESALPGLSGPTEVEITPSYPDTVIRVSVTLGSIVVDPASGTFPLQVEVDNARRLLVPGVSCKVVIPARSGASP